MFRGFVIHFWLLKLCLQKRICNRCLIFEATIAQKRKFMQLSACF